MANNYDEPTNCTDSSSSCEKDDPLANNYDEPANCTSCEEKDDVINPEDNSGDKVQPIRNGIPEDSIPDDDKWIDIEEIIKTTVSKFESRIEKVKNIFEKKKDILEPILNLNLVKSMLQSIRTWPPALDTSENSDDNFIGEVGEPEVGEPEVLEPEVEDPNLGEPEVGEPEVGEPEVGEPEVGEPEVGEPEVGEPGVGEPEVGEPEVGEPDLGEPDLGEPEVGVTETGEPELEGPEPGEIDPEYRKVCKTFCSTSVSVNDCERIQGMRPAKKDNMNSFLKWKKNCEICNMCKGNPGDNPKVDLGGNSAFHSAFQSHSGDYTNMDRF